MEKFIMILLLGVGTFVSCDEPDGPAIPELSPKYRLVEAQSNIPIDLNFDGIEELDLLSEIPELRGMALITNPEIPFIDIVWVEPQINDELLYLPLPSEYNDDDNIKYQPVQNPYYYKVDNNLLKLRTRIVNNNGHYTFSSPRQITIERGSGNLHFKASQQFLTKKGIVTVQIEAEYRQEE